MSEVTRILQAMDRGDRTAADELLPRVYDELRKLAAQKMAHERPGQTLSATALVHEAYIRLVDTEKVQHWNSRRHFFAAAAEAMRRILVDRARQKLSLKRGATRTRQGIGAADEIATGAVPEEVLGVHEAIDALAADNELAAEVVKLRYFAGFSMEEAAQILEISRATAYRLWTYGRAWLRVFLTGKGE